MTVKKDLIDIGCEKAIPKPELLGALSRFFGMPAVDWENNPSGAEFAYVTTKYSGDPRSVDININKAVNLFDLVPFLSKELNLELQINNPYEDGDFLLVMPHGEIVHFFADDHCADIVVPIRSSFKPFK